VTAQLVSVSGEVSGTITAKDKLEIHPSGRVEGNIKTKDLIIHSGAIFVGKCDMKEESPSSDIDVPDLIAENEEDELEETEKESGKDDEEDGEKIEIEA
jgi:cytoskeletal protein CcmA (bactofilin family)